MKQFFLLIFLIGVPTTSVLAVVEEASFMVRPTIIDEKGHPRDSILRTITLLNGTESKLIVYASVANVAPEDGTQGFADPSRADLTSSLANWVEVTRGAIELLPREEKQLDVRINVNLRASPGTYHALLAFHEGPTREEAERSGARATIAINIDVTEIVRERMTLSSFAPERTFVLGSPARFLTRLTNSGDRPTSPQGEVRLYNRRGVEVAAIPFNKEGASLASGMSEQFNAEWNASGWGRYSAQLVLEYGNGKSLQGSALVWLIPWKGLALIFVLLVGVLMVFAYMLRRRLEAHAHHTRARRKHAIIDLRR